MVDLERAVQALHKAHEAGNTEDARRIAQYIQAVRGQQTSTPDRSFGSALAYGTDQMLENIGTTARALGSESLGDLGSDVIQAPGNYEPAAERFINPGEDDLTILGYGVEYLPRAVVEQVPQMAGSLGARGAGAALGGAVGMAAGPVGGAIGAGVGAFAGPAILSFAQQFGPIALERARRNGREEPDWDDWVAAAAGAGGSAALDALSILPIGKAGTSILNAAAREGLTETVQSGIEQTASTLGTDEGFEFSAKQALGEGMIGAGAGGTMQAGADTVRGARQVPGAIRDTYQNVQAGLEYSRNPEQIRSDLRIADLYEARVAAERAFDSGKEVSADETFKSITVDLERELKGLADTLYRAGDITKAQRDEIRQAVTRAKRHNYELGERGEESGYFDTEVDTIRQMDLPDQTKQTLINSLRDLNTAAFNSMKKNRRGPIEAMMQKVGTPSGAAAGAWVGGAPGAVLGSTIGGTTAGRIGRIGDQILGLDQPPILRRAEARRRVLEGRQEYYGNTVRDIQAAFQDASSRQKLVVTQQQAQDPQTPIDQTLRDLGVERQGGWVRSMVDYANQNLVPGQRPITQQDLTNAIEELKELGALTEGQAKELLDNKSGVITDERVYYGLQDYLIFRARQEAPGAGSDLTEGVTTQETPQASPAAPETPSVRPDAPQSRTIYNPLSYAQTMENVRQATNNAMATAPGPMASMVTEVANARTREAKRQVLENAREWYPEYREWIDQYLEPLTKFGPQETSSEPFRPQVIRRDSRGRPLQRQPFNSEAAEKILGAYPKVIDGRLRKSNYPRPPDPISREEAKIYKARAGINKPPLTKTLDIPTDYLKRVADWMDKAQHEPDNPAVQRSYAALIQETMAQYEAIGSDLKVEAYDGQGEPYRNAGEMLDDVRENRHLWFFRTESGFGEGDLDRSHPMLQETPYTDTQGRPLLVNDLFRIVHDYFGHTQNATQFGPKGEYNAFHEHARMFSDEAVPALAAETLAQNAWVNFGPHLRNEKGDIPKKGEPGYIPPSERPFSDQKATIVPLELLRQDPNQGALEANDRSLGIDPFTGDHPDRVSVRRPSSKKAPQGILTEEPQITSAPFLRNPDLAAKAAAQFKGYPWFKSRSRKPETVIQEYIDQLADNIVWVHDQMDPDLRGTASMWYEGGRKLVDQWSQDYGIPDRAAAGILATLSPGMDWYKNVSLANRVMDTIVNNQDTLWSPEMETKAGELFKTPKSQEILKAIRGKRLADLEDPVEKATWIRLYDQTYRPQTYEMWSPDGRKLGLNQNQDGSYSTLMWQTNDIVAKAVEIFENPSLDVIHNRLGFGNKVRSFYNNLLAPNAPHGDVTIDTHAVAAAVLSPVSQSSLPVGQNFGSAKGSIKSAVEGVNGTYGIYADAYRQAADRLGLLPRALQSITWEQIRVMFPGSKKKGLERKTDAVWKDYKSGKIDINEAREKIRAITGEIERPSWADAGAARDLSRGGPGDPSNPLHVAEGLANDPGGLPGAGVPGGGALSVAGGTGGGNPGGPRVTYPTRQEAQKEAFRLRGETGQLHMVQETEDGFIAVPLKPKEPDFGVRPSDLALPDGPPSSRIQERLQGDIRRSGGGLLSAVDPEGRELASRFIVGASSGDFGGLTNPEIERVGAILADVFSVAGAAKTGGAFGAVDYQGSQDQGGHMALYMRDERTPQNEAQWRSTFNHEIGHVVEIRAGIGLMYADAAEADAVMTDLINASREARPYLWTEDDAELARMAPEGRGAQWVRDYRQSHGQGGELFADTIRLYMEQGNAFKQRYPHAAKFIRDVVNESKIKDVIGFTSFAGLGISTILAIGLSGLGGEDEPQEETRPLLYS